MMASVPHETASLEVLLSALPSLPRSLLARLTARMIERLDEMDGDPELEDDDPGGGNVEDEGETAASEDCGHVGDYLTDQRTLSWRYGTHRID
jgi:hypothetical protein